MARHHPGVQGNGRANVECDAVDVSVGVGNLLLPCRWQLWGVEEHDANVPSLPNQMRQLERVVRDVAYEDDAGARLEHSPDAFNCALSGPQGKLGDDRSAIAEGVEARVAFWRADDGDTLRRVLLGAINLDVCRKE